MSSLLNGLTGQLSRHAIGCKNAKSKNKLIRHKVKNVNLTLCGGDDAIVSQA